MTGTARVGEAVGDGVGVITGWKVGSVTLGTATVGGTFSVKVGGGVALGVGDATVVSDGLGDGVPPKMSVLFSGPAGPVTVPPGATVPIASNVPNGGAELGDTRVMSRSHPDSATAHSTSATRRLLTWTRRG